MYFIIKQILIRMLSRKLLFRLEPCFRCVYGVFYLGKQFQCTICEINLRDFVHHSDQKICPNCGSIQRTRKLYQLIKENYLVDKSVILDFSPSRCLYRKWQNIPNINYFSTDISGDFLSDFRYDICHIESSSNRFDLVICYHILEHIEDDIQAMSELFRVIKPGGTCIVQTPFKDGDVYEDETKVSKEDRLLHFGQEDHVRIYSLYALSERLKKVGFQVDVLTLNEKINNRYGLKTNEQILIAKK